MSGLKHTPGPWTFVPAEPEPDDHYERNMGGVRAPSGWVCDFGDGVEYYPTEGTPPNEADARLIAAAPELLEALHEGRRAIGDHYAPNDCYATGPVTGDAFRDLVECPACAFIAKYDAAIAKATGGAA